MDNEYKRGSNTCKIVLLYCRNSVPDDSGLALAASRAVGFSVKAVILPCSSKIQVSHMLKILDKEADGLDIIACPGGNCQLLVGSCRTGKRVAYARSLLKQIGVNENRLAVTHRANVTVDDLMEIAAYRAEVLKNLKKEGTNS